MSSQVTIPPGLGVPSSLSAACCVGCVPPATVAWAAPPEPLSLSLSPPQAASHAAPSPAAPAPPARNSRRRPVLPLIHRCHEPSPLATIPLPESVPYRCRWVRP